MKVQCNCPLCSKTPMEDGKVYRCQKGGIMGVVDMHKSGPSDSQIKKIMTETFANEEAEKEIDEQIKDALK